MKGFITSLLGQLYPEELCNMSDDDFNHMLLIWGMSALFVFPLTFLWTCL